MVDGTAVAWKNKNVVNTNVIAVYKYGPISRHFLLKLFLINTFQTRLI